MFARVLIANRGEVAARIVVSCQRLGVRTVLLASEPELDSYAARRATQVVCVGPGPASLSYLNQDAILQAALQYQCQAIHPGYGFLAEDARFAQRCLLQGSPMIGPSVRFLTMAQDKQRSSAWARQHGLPCLPSSPTLATPQQAREAAALLGYPLMLKATTGGGGKGMRRCADQAQLDLAWTEVRLEHPHSPLFLERLVENARHLEFQFLGDCFGRVLGLGQRDCSVQRKNQKVLEESPVLGVDELLLQRFAGTLEKALAHSGLQGLATVECLLSETQELYFLEINPRLQVEHPVTESRSTLDLVEWQLRLAANAALPDDPSFGRLREHAIELRLLAEDPAQDWLPCTGRLQASSIDEALRFALHAPLRVDTHLVAGCELLPYYDSLLAKLICRAPTRLEALEGLADFLDTFELPGLSSNLILMRRLLRSPELRAGCVDSLWLERASRQSI